MALDRLAAARAQKSKGQHIDASYELGQARPAILTPSDDMTAFYNEISAIQDLIKEFNDNVSRISALHLQSLSVLDEVATQQNASQLNQLVQDTSTQSGELRRRIQSLEGHGGNERERHIRKQQTNLVKSKLVEAVQNYQSVEQKYRAKYRQRLETQVKTVKPDATTEEIQAAINGESGGQVFTQALKNSTRYDSSRLAYREVQERHEDIKRVERTLGELAQLMNDMSIIVEKQDEAINATEGVTAAVELDMETGLHHTTDAVIHAARARKMRRICFMITLCILVIVGIVLAVVFGRR